MNIGVFPSCIAFFFAFLLSIFFFLFFTCSLDFFFFFFFFPFFFRFGRRFVSSCLFLVGMMCSYAVFRFLLRFVQRTWI